MLEKNNLSWKIGGEAGFGIKSAGMIFAKIFMRAGYETFDYTEYPSLIRGGHNTYQLIVDTRPVNSVSRGVDVLVALNQNTVTENAVELNRGGIIIYDSDKVKLPEEADQDSYDPDYYIYNQILPGVERIFDVFGINVNDYFTEKAQSSLSKFL